MSVTITDRVVAELSLTLNHTCNNTLFYSLLHALARKVSERDSSEERSNCCKKKKRKLDTFYRRRPL